MLGNSHHDGNWANNGRIGGYYPLCSLTNMDSGQVNTELRKHEVKEFVRGIAKDSGGDGGLFSSMTMKS